MASKEELLSRTDEEWTAVYESGGAEYWEDKAELYSIHLTDARAELAWLRGQIREELEAIKRHIAVTPKDSKWWMWSHGVKDALEALLETAVTKEEGDGQEVD